jgi:hypothetical protein
METISLKEVLAIMDKKQPFQIAFITLNKKMNTGGEWIELLSAVKHTTRTIDGGQLTVDNQHRIYKNPRHYDNATRNLRNCLSGDLVKVHIRLIRRFNNKVVV